jgi:hypothetical protein
MIRILSVDDHPLLGEHATEEELMSGEIDGLRRIAAWKSTERLRSGSPAESHRTIDPPKGG